MTPNPRWIGAVLGLLAVAGSQPARTVDKAAALRELQAIYAEYDQSWFANDPGAALKFLRSRMANDFQAELPNGQFERRKDLEKDLVAAAAAAKPIQPTGSIVAQSSSIQDLQVRGNTALATVIEWRTFVGTGAGVGDKGAKGTHTYDFEMLSRDTWQQGPAGWAFTRSKQLRVLLKRDGQVIQQEVAKPVSRKSRR